MSPESPPPSDGDGGEPLLRVSGLVKHFPIQGGLLNRTQGYVRAVDGVDFELQPGETFAIVGESGCGKTTLGKVIARLLRPTDGTIHFDGRDISGLSGKQLKPIRRELQVVYQDPSSSLNPRRRVKNIVADPLIVHGIGTKRERRRRIAEMLDLVDLPEEFLYRYPNELSGGQQQRVAIVRALILNPQLVILDEPTSALDVSVQVKVISLLDRLQQELDLTYIVISHDLSLVKNIADRIAVMYLGEFMEVAPTNAIFERPRNPYTEQLLSAIPIIESEELDMRPDSVTATGEPPDPSNPPNGCSFHPRCHKRFGACDQVEPALTNVATDHAVRCLLYPGEKREEVDQLSDRSTRERLRETALDDEMSSPLDG
ncbi:MAG: ABC transporter ATP-binding protein [Halobacteriota archaeon]